MKKLLVSDYDQTFYINDEDIEKNKIAVNEFRSKGNIFVIATGRSYDDFMKKKKHIPFRHTVTGMIRMLPESPFLSHFLR